MALATTKSARDSNSPPRLVSVAILGLPQPLTYSVSTTLSQASTGDEVLVPLGKRQRSGWIIESDIDPESIAIESSKNKAEKKQIEIFEPNASQSFKEILKAEPAFLPAQIQLFKLMSQYYGVSIAEILSTAFPKRHKPKQVLSFSLNSQEEAKGVLESLKKKAPLQAEIISLLLSAGKALRLEEFNTKQSSTRSALRSLEKKELVTSKLEDVDVLEPQLNSQYVTTPSELTKDQQLAIKKITQSLNAKHFAPHLLLGVTGSGKTEVYIQAIKQALLLGKTALLLVPEISLTPQLVDQLSTRLSIELALLHSQVGSAARWRYWSGLRNGKFSVAVGARSALFAPLPNLGLIIVDEEHETSYKQSDGFRYHGRDVAVMRAKTEECTLILGSATPSLETLLNVQKKRYKLLELPTRVHQRAVPKIEIIDLLKIPLKKMPSPTISPDLNQAITDTLSKKQQAVILYNKRGFSSYLQCDTCGEAVCCNECSVALTYHKGKKVLLCHYCGHQQQPPEGCGFCRNPETVRIEEEGTSLPGELSHRGAGTERVVEDIAELFPQARIARMDRDTVGAKDSYRNILDSMRSGEADILVGTQMIAKGHDLPGVTLVGIIDADVGLHVPDFRTSERVYQLITQAAGRAGRGEFQGRVLVQTRQSSHPTIIATATGRFLAFARFQLEQREKLGYPPHGRLLRIITSAPQQRSAIATAEQLVARYKIIAEQDENKFQILGPAPAPHQRLRGLFRWHILIKSSSASQLAKIAFATHSWRKSDMTEARIAVDVDPVDML